MEVLCLHSLRTLGEAGFREVKVNVEEKEEKEQGKCNDSDDEVKGLHLLGIKTLLLQ